MRVFEENLKVDVAEAQQNPSNRQLMIELKDMLGFLGSVGSTIQEVHFKGRTVDGSAACTVSFQILEPESVDIALLRVSNPPPMVRYSSATISVDELSAPSLFANVSNLQVRDEKDFSAGLFRRTVSYVSGVAARDQSFCSEGFANQLAIPSICSKTTVKIEIERDRENNLRSISLQTSRSGLLNVDLKSRRCFFSHESP